MFRYDERRIFENTRPLRSLPVKSKRSILASIRACLLCVYKFGTKAAHGSREDRSGKENDIASGRVMQKSFQIFETLQATQPVTLSNFTNNDDSKMEFHRGNVATHFVEFYRNCSVWISVER